MDFDPTETERMVADAVRNALASTTEHHDRWRRMVHVDKAFPADLWQLLCDAGVMGCVIPESYGGNGLGLVAGALAIEEMAALGFGNAFVVLGTMDATAILHAGSEELKQRVLPGIASGAIKCCFAITEPDAGSNAFRMTTLARRDGAGWRITGQKAFITGADVADRMLVVVRTTSRQEIEAKNLPKAFGLGLFFVDTKSPGIHLSPIPTHGIEGMTQFMVHFDDVWVPDADIVGEPDMGSLVMFNSLNPERITAAAIACGMARYALGKSVAYANERRLFRNTPIGAYQGVAHPLARARVWLEACQLLVRRAAWAFDAQKDPREIGSYANHAKYESSRMVMEAVDRSIQTHGGYGFSEEYGIIWLFESARLLQTAPINNELILSYVAEHDMGLPRSY